MRWRLADHIAYLAMNVVKRVSSVGHCRTKQSSTVLSIPTAFAGEAREVGKCSWPALVTTIDVCVREADFEHAAPFAVSPPEDRYF
jgi:hypothetical protein